MDCCLTTQPQFVGRLDFHLFLHIQSLEKYILEEYSFRKNGTSDHRNEQKNKNTLQYKIPPKTWENSPQKSLLATRKWFFGHFYVINVHILEKLQGNDFFETCSKLPSFFPKYGQFTLCREIFLNLKSVTAQCA